MITLDFESYYSKGDYSLSSMTLEEYIRDPRFQPIMVSVMVDDNPPVNHTGDEVEIYEQLRQYNWDQAVCSHNALFDMSILCWRFNIYPKLMVDTLAMARKLFGIEQSCSLAACAKRYNLPEKGGYVTQASGLRREQFTPQMLKDYADYCDHDTWLCRQIFKLMRPHFPVEEMMAIDWSTQIMARPTLRINVPKAQQALQDFRTQRDNALNALGVTQDALRSDEIMASMLIRAGVEPPTKESPKQKNLDGTPKIMWAFAKSDIPFMDLLESNDPVVSALVDARLANKTSIVETRLSSFVEIGQRGSLPYPLGYAGALPTDRWQAALGQKINLQNLPRAPKGGRSPLRDAIEPPPGYKLGVIDLSQIELRVAAWLSGQQDVLDMLRNGIDVYSSQASEVYGFVVDKKQHPLERFVGKVACLSCMYGVGGQKFTHMLQSKARQEGLTLADESETFGTSVVMAWRRKNYMTTAFWKVCEQALGIMAAGGDGQIGCLPIRGGKILMPDGMWMHYPNLRQFTSSEGKTGWVYDKYRGRGGSQPKWIYGGLLFENLCQRIARGIMRDGLLRLRQRFWVCGSVHDELIYLVLASANMAEAKQYALDCMTYPASYAPELPLAAEGDIGDCYGDVK